MTEENTAAAAVMTSPSYNGDKVLPKRNGSKGLLPSTWTGRTISAEYVVCGELRSTTATLLDVFPAGPVLNAGGRRTLIAWETLAVVELVED